MPCGRAAPGSDLTIRRIGVPLYMACPPPIAVATPRLSGATGWIRDETGVPILLLIHPGGNSLYRRPIQAISPLAVNTRSSTRPELDCLCGSPFGETECPHSFLWRRPERVVSAAGVLWPGDSGSHPQAGAAKAICSLRQFAPGAALQGLWQTTTAPGIDRQSR